MKWVAGASVQVDVVSWFEHLEDFRSCSWDLSSPGLATTDQITGVHRLEQLTNLNTCLIELFWEIMNYDLLLSMGSMECVTQADQAAVNGLILWDDRMIKPFRANMLSKDCSYDTWVRSSMMEEARLLASSTALSSVGLETSATCGHQSQDKASTFLLE